MKVLLINGSPHREGNTFIALCLAGLQARCFGGCMPSRGGASATFDRLNKYFTINNMPVVSSQYWNSVHGRLPGEASQDIEGLQTMRTLGRNMAWLLKQGGACPTQ